MTASACLAPHSALYFEPSGEVRACCSTTWTVGTVTGPARASLTDIWRGLDLRDQRDRLDDGRFDMGCQECEFATATGGREVSLAAHFDGWGAGGPHEFPTVLDFALSNRCNLACVMCNGDLSSTIRKHEGRPALPSAYDDRFFDELDEFLPHVRLAQFKGGEPFLAPENRRVWEAMIRLASNDCVTTVTTNATVWNEEVERFVDVLRMAPNISIDGMTRATFESIRVGADFDRVWHHVDRFQEATERNGRDLILNFCVMTTNWQEVPAFLAEVDRRGVRCLLIPVEQPSRFDLLRLADHELGGVVAELRDREPALAHAPAKEAWAGLLRRLDAPPSARSARPVGVRVPVRVPARLARSGGAELRERRRSLAEAGREVAEVDVVGGVVTAVRDAPWARWLDLGSWVGERQSDIQPLIQRAAGAAPAVDVDHRGAATLVVRMTWSAGVAAPGIEVQFVATSSSDEGEETATALLVPVVRPGLSRL